MVVEVDTGRKKEGRQANKRPLCVWVASLFLQVLLRRAGEQLTVLIMGTVPKRTLFLRMLPH